MTTSKTLTRALCACLATAVLAPAGALAHDGTGDARTWSGTHEFRHHHHRMVFLKGTVSSVDTSAGTIVVKVAKASRGGQALIGNDVTVTTANASAFKPGDEVWVKTKRRFIDASANKVMAARAFSADNADAFRDAGDGDHHCDH
jgi:hypothetical protein